MRLGRTRVIKFSVYVAGTLMFTESCKGDEPGFDCEADGMLAIEEVISTPSGCGGDDATILVRATGSEGYLYALDDGIFQQSEVFEGLASREYQIMVQDKNKCQQVVQYSVLSGISYQDDIQPLIEMNCAIPDCHDGSNINRVNLSRLSTVQQFGTLVKDFTQNRDMPRGGALTQEEIDLIACWVDDGAPNN